MNKLGVEKEIRAESTFPVLITLFSFCCIFPNADSRTAVIRFWLGFLLPELDNRANLRYH